MKTTLTATIPAEHAQKRLDQALHALFPDYSRARLQEWIKQGAVAVDGQIITKTKNKVNVNQNIVINATIEDAGEWLPQNIPLDVVYEDNDLMVINKPAGLVVHPGAGVKDGTLVNALLYYYPELATVPRAGIIHRLDKDTSGLLIVARNLPSHNKLVTQLQRRKIKREYEAIVYGKVTAGGTIEAAIGRHKVKRTEMAVTTSGGKPAVTHYRVLERFATTTHLKIALETGRTHQIRVHLTYLQHPIVGDQTYGGRIKLPPNTSPELRIILQNFKRQALHARRLSLKHPTTGKVMEWESPLPNDMIELLQQLRLNNAQSLS